MPEPRPGRRLGTAGSHTRAALLDAAERLLMDQGYAAVTSRRVAAEAGLKPQLVHYYFRSMDDLLLETFRRRADASLRRFERETARDRSLRHLWSLLLDLRGARFLLELVALASHRPSVRSEIARYAERFRSAQQTAVTAALADLGVPPDVLPPEVALLALTGVSQVMAIEQALGVTTGHDVTAAFVDRLIAGLEDRRPSSGTPPVTDAGSSAPAGRS